jgi:glycosyltransferase involved in cell wall biosynthesis
MKILLLTDYFPPEVNAPATRGIEHCREWLKLGAEVTVITCAPNFPQGKVHEGYRNRLYQVEDLDGIRVIRVWSYIARNEGFYKRAIDFVSFAFTAFWAGLFERCDVIVATSPPFFITFAGYALSKVKRRPWLFEVRDIWPESIRTLGAMKSSPVLDLLEKIELALYRDAKTVIAVTDAFKRNFIRRGISPDKIAVVTNGANLDLYQAQGKNAALASRLGLDGKFVVSYIGTHGMAHALEFIVGNLDKVQDESIHFLFIGDGAKKPDVVQLAATMALKNVTFLDPVPKEMVADYLSITDVALVPLLKNDTFKEVIPSKIFESSAMRKPILLGVEGQAQEIVEKYGAGVCFEPENGTDFLAKLAELRTNRTFYEECQDGCSRLAADYDRKVLAAKMLGLLEDAVNSKP